MRFGTNKRKTSRLFSVHVTISTQFYFVDFLLANNHNTICLYSNIVQYCFQIFFTICGRNFFLEKILQNDFLSFDTLLLCKIVQLCSNHSKSSENSAIDLYSQFLAFSRIISYVNFFINNGDSVYSSGSFNMPSCMNVYKKK